MDITATDDKMDVKTDHGVPDIASKTNRSADPDFIEKCPGHTERKAPSSDDPGVLPEKIGTAIMDDTLTLKLESARGRLESSRSSLRYQRPLNTANSNHNVSFTGTRSRTSYQLPIVYFVVRKDRMPRLAENFSDNDQKASLKVYATKSRHQFLTRRREKKRQRDEEEKRVKGLGPSVGLKVEPVKTHNMPCVSKSWLSKQPTTPFNTISERSELNSPETVFYNHDDLPMEHQPRGSSAGSDNYNMSRGCPEKPRLTPFDLELPGLKTVDNRSDTPGSCSSKKVHFTKTNPRSKSCNIQLQLPKVDQSAEEFLEAEQKQSVKTKEPKRSKTVLPTAITPNPKPRRDANPLSLPKIDLITPIYDELILKTFQAFMSKKNPLSDKNARAILQRVSASLHPLDDTTKFQERKTPSSRPRTRETSFFSTEPPVECLDLEYTDVSSTSITIDGKSMSMMMRDVDSKQRRAQVPSTCFQMAPPGLGREETENLVLSDKKPDIYIPSSCY